MPKKYPDEFKENVVKVAKGSDSSVAQIARDFGISQPCLSRWIREVSVGDDSGSAQPSVAEFRELKKRLRLVEQENEILRRATAYFARDALPK